jgi:hypothetical protein
MFTYAARVDLAVEVADHPATGPGQLWSVRELVKASIGATNGLVTWSRVSFTHVRLRAALAKYIFLTHAIGTQSPREPHRIDSDSDIKG